MIARMAWACNILPALDPTTKKPVELNIKYEPVANPKPYPFPAVIEARSQSRLDFVKEKAHDARSKDVLI